VPHLLQTVSNRLRLFACLLPLSLFLTAALPAHAQTYTWTAAGAYLERVYRALELWPAELDEK